MQKYQSHKVVEAAKIKAVIARSAPIEGLEWWLHFVKDHDNVQVPLDWILKHSPNGQSFGLQGGYFVRCPDGYTSWSPAEAFEEGYTRVPEHYRVTGDDGQPVENLMERLGVADRVAGLPVAGYKPTQSAAAVATVSRFKEIEERVLRMCETELHNFHLKGHPDKCDPSWMAEGMKLIQMGFMLVNRSIFQPGRVTLPEDGQ